MFAIAGPCIIVTARALTAWCPDGCSVETFMRIYGDLVAAAATILAGALALYAVRWQFARDDVRRRTGAKIALAHQMGRLASFMADQFSDGDLYVRSGGHAGTIRHAIDLPADLNIHGFLQDLPVESASGAAALFREIAATSSSFANIPVFANDEDEANAFALKSFRDFALIALRTYDELAAELGWPSHEIDTPYRERLKAWGAWNDHDDAALPFTAAPRPPLPA